MIDIRSAPPPARCPRRPADPLRLAPGDLPRLALGMALVACLVGLLSLASTPPAGALYVAGDSGEAAAATGWQDEGDRP